MEGGSGKSIDQRMGRMEEGIEGTNWMLHKFDKTNVLTKTMQMHPRRIQRIKKVIKDQNNPKWFT